MLPILPAIILLLLHGPSNFERLAGEGRLPQALQAIHRHIDEPTTRREAEDAVLASLLASGADPRLSGAILAFLRGRPAKPSNRPVTGREAQIVSPTDEPAARVHSGFAQCQRSRDGPR